MMKYAIMSDIHGNLEAFKAAVSDARKRGCGMMVCLGDLTGYGDRSRECVDFAMKTMDVCLMGNHDIVCCGKEEPRTASTIPETANCDWFSLNQTRNEEAGVFF